MNMPRPSCWADAPTIVNLSCGVSAKFAAIQGHPEIGAALIALAVVWDSLDGKVAAWTRHGGREFGKQLDSLGDLVSFGRVPACSFVGMNEPSWPAIAPLPCFVGCGMPRLARYNISTGKVSREYRSRSTAACRFRCCICFRGFFLPVSASGPRRSR